MKLFRTCAHRSLTWFNTLSLVIAGFGGGVMMIAAPKSAMACGPEVYIGSVCTFGFSYCPSGFVPANGQLVAVSSNSALFALFGTTYGGNGTTTFGLPDLRSRSAVGVGQGAGLPPFALGQPLGQSSATLLASNVPPHTHAASFAGTGGGNQTVNVPADAGTLAVTAALQGRQATGTASMVAGAILSQGGTGSGSANIYGDPNAPGTLVNLGGLTAGLTGSPGHGPISFSYNAGITGGTVSVMPNVGGQPFSTQSPVLGLTLCIATSGLYPPRP